MEKLYKPFIVWERHELSDQKLGRLDGDVPHQFDSEKDARAFIYKVAHMQPKCDRYFREVMFSDYCRGIDFGSYSDFFVLESRDYDCPLN